VRRVVSKAAVPDPTVVDASAKCFKPEHLTRYDLLQTRVEKLQLVDEVLKYRIDEIQRRARAEAQAKVIELSRNSKELTEAIAELEQYQSELGPIYRVDFKRVTFDSTTGELHVESQVTEGG